MQKAAYLWDIDPKKGISPRLYYARVMMHGRIRDWKRILHKHDLEEIKKYIVESKGRLLNNRVLPIWAHLLGIPQSTCNQWMKGWVPWSV